MALPEFRNEPFTDFTTEPGRAAMLDALRLVGAELGKEVPLVIGGKRGTPKGESARGAPRGAGTRARRREGGSPPRSPGGEAGGRGGRQGGTAPVFLPRVHRGELL